MLKSIKRKIKKSNKKIYGVIYKFVNKKTGEIFIGKTTDKELTKNIQDMDYLYNNLFKLTPAIQKSILFTLFDGLLLEEKVDVLSDFSDLTIKDFESLSEDDKMEVMIVMYNNEQEDSNRHLISKLNLN